MSVCQYVNCFVDTVDGVDGKIGVMSGNLEKLDIMKPHIVIYHEAIRTPGEISRKKRTTYYYFKGFGIQIVVWKKQYRPSVKAMLRVTDEQIESARARMLEFETASI